MNENFVVTNGNEIAFISDIYRPNGLRTQINPDALYSKHGFLVPLSPCAFNLLAYLDGDDSSEGLLEGALRGWLITHSGRIEEWSIGDKNGKRSMLKRLVPWGQGIVGIRGAYVETEETLFASMDFHENDIRKALMLASDTLREGPAPIHIMSIPAIVEELNKRFPQKG
ncbi:hypothetical protein [Streptomyces sp. CHB9.2]|uniref:hypothetical protein n=1 Tax=Streptomyces sp. CHB9.2 TaxID=2841670 RepID=UPI002095E9AB|nr:hypothetical protein [Streptomyces sp. CHB9.2]MCO6704773.1 hypothetical protein [Streptomyces sp. CHB9.2]